METARSLEADDKAMSVRCPLQYSAASLLTLLTLVHPHRLVSLSACFFRLGSQLAIVSLAGTVNSTSDAAKKPSVALRITAR